MNRKPHQNFLIMRVLLSKKCSRFTFCVISMFIITGMVRSRFTEITVLLLNPAFLPGLAVKN